MKNIKKIVISIIMTVLLVSGAYKILASNANNIYGADEREPLPQNDSSTTETISFWQMLEYLDNVYCIEHNQNFMGTITFTKTTKVVIEGNTAKFYTYNKNKKAFDKLVKTVADKKENNILAAILCPEDLGRGGKFGDKYSYGFKMLPSSSSYNNEYTDAQLGLYGYINTWIDAVGGTEFQFERQADNVLNEFSKKDREYANKAIESAINLANQYDFKVTLYLHKSGVWMNQALISTYPESPSTNSKSIPVKKSWDDDGGEYIDSITVKLFANDVDTGKIVVLNKDNNWESKFEDLEVYDKDKKTIQYTIKEVKVTGYEPIIIGDQQQGFTITNTPQLVELAVSKVWEDNSNQDGKRPTSIKVTLCEDGKTTNQTVTLRSPEWQTKFEGLPKYKKGKLVDYTVKEEVVTAYPDAEYSKSTDADGNIYYVIKNTHKPETTEIKVLKEWDDNEDQDGIRPATIKVTLCKNGEPTTQTVTLQAPDWKAEISNLPKYEAGKEIEYSVQEELVAGYIQPEYIKSQDKDGKIVYRVKNTHEVERTELRVEKYWNDDNNRDAIRPATIKVTLYANGEATEQTATLNKDNWSYVFERLPKNKDGKTIDYTVQEEVVTGYSNPEYTKTTDENGNTIYKITNTHIPEKTKLQIKKVWDDQENLDDLRPTKIKVTLYANGVSTGKTVELDASENWEKEFTDLFKYENGKIIEYTVEEEVVSGYPNPEYTKNIDENGNVIYTLTNKHKPHYDGYVEITGKVWLDGKDGKANEINGTAGDETDKLLKDIKVTLKDGEGKQFDATSTAVTDENGNYTIRVNYDNSYKVYKLYEDVETVKSKLANAYVEFEYDGIKYTTVKNETMPSENKSIAVEKEDRRLDIDKAYSTVNPTTNPENWTANITATTGKIISYASKNENREEIIKYCNGKDIYQHTNSINAWGDINQSPTHKCQNCEGKEHTRTFEVEVIRYENINLGLFEREKPDVAIYSDLSKVEVTMDGQRYTYLYNVRSDKFKDAELKVKFQNKDTYTYRRPVNPADIAYIQEEAHKDAMSVLVTYEVKVANLSSTLNTTIHNITNSYDSRYTLNTQGWTVTNKTEYNEATSGDLNIVLAPQTESEPIQLTYSISLEAIRGLLNEEPTLNNAVEIHTYSTQYGEKTLYAEQRIGERTNQPYAGYDVNSAPGNAGLFINGEGRLEVTKPEDDTDIAPSFVLCKDDVKILSGIVWEDSDSNEEDEERLGDGQYNTSEKKVQNVKVELYNMNGKLAKLYDKDGNEKDAIVYTNQNGEYSLEGVVTGEYFIKYTYGNGTENATKIEETTVNARNYKSTIITEGTIRNIFGKDYTQFTETEKMWHITHQDGYSIAADNMLDRLDISALTNSTYKNGENMTAYTKPFKTQVEFETTGQSQVRDESGNIGISNNLSKFDFGIIERPRENLFVEKTIKYFRLTLANGQILTEGYPNDPNANINYAKAIGFNQTRNSLEKQLLVEVDQELIQGAKLEIQYAVKVTNNNEVDYDYEDYETGYNDIVKDITENENDKYITRKQNANYYYYGDKTGLNPINATIEFVDYMDNEIIYNDDSTKWKIIYADKLFENGLISEDTFKALKNNKYDILQSANGDNDIKITLASNTSFEKDMLASKVLANEEQNNFDNNVEIIKIDGKTARTVKGGGENYIPGNYIPSSNISEQDDDRVKIIITPPTGITNYIITYVTIVLIGLIIICIGLVFIKKKVLTK